MTRMKPGMKRIGKKLNIFLIHFIPPYSVSSVFLFIWTLRLIAQTEL